MCACHVFWSMTLIWLNFWDGQRNWKAEAFRNDLQGGSYWSCQDVSAFSTSVHHLLMVIFLFVNNGVWNSVQNSSTISITSFRTISIWQYTISFPFLFSLSPSLGMIGSSVLHFNDTLMLPVHPHFYYPFLWTHMWIVHYFKFLIFYHTFHCILWSLVDYIFKSQRKQEAVRWFICQ